MGSRGRRLGGGIADDNAAGGDGMVDDGDAAGGGVMVAAGANGAGLGDRVLPPSSGLPLLHSGYHQVQ